MILSEDHNILHASNSPVTFVTHKRVCGPLLSGVLLRKHTNIYLLIGDVDDRQNFLFVFIHVKISPSLNPFTAKFSRKQISTKFPNFIQWNFKKQIALCVSTESFHLNGHIIGFCPQTERLDSPYKTPSNTLAVKGYLKVTAKFTFVIISVSVTIFYY